MRKFVLFMIPLGLIVAQDAKPPANTKPTKQKTKPAAAPQSGSISIPPDAVGEKVDKKLDDLLEKGPAPPPAGAPVAPSAPSVANAAPPSATVQGPGIDIGGGFKGCQPNDSTPAGTVQNGLRKVEIATPFGKSCRWEPAK